jgi:hypothetical protein
MLKTGRNRKAIRVGHQNNTNMDPQDQRKDGLKLAIQLNAPKTQELIKEPNSSLEAILKSAEAEVGVDKLVSVILNHHPQWALGALRHLPNIGPHETALREKARVTFLASTPNNIVGASEATPGLIDVSQLKMYIACGAGYVANFTIWYFTPPFNNEWTQSTIKSGDQIPVCQSQTKDCSFFSVESTPIKAGDTVMMVLNIAGNKDWVPTNIWFTYNPDTKKYAEVDCHGQTLNPSFTYSVIQS